jgi:hypothetical protein
MRKNIIAVLFIVFSLITFAGSNSPLTAPKVNASKDSIKTNITLVTADSINIRQMVLAQFDAARKKQAQDTVAAADTTTIKSTVQKAAVITQAVVTLKPKPQKTQWETYFSYIEPAFRAVCVSKEMTIKLSIMGSVSFMAFLFVIVRRKKLNTKKTIKRDNKDGIKLIREERVKDKKDSKLSQIRNKLIGSTSAYNLTNDSVSKNARELNIAKGEIYLAARIKSHELKKASY